MVTAHILIEASLTTEACHVILTNSNTVYANIYVIVVLLEVEPNALCMLN